MRRWVLVMLAACGGREPVVAPPPPPPPPPDAAVDAAAAVVPVDAAEPVVAVDAGPPESPPRPPRVWSGKTDGIACAGKGAPKIKKPTPPPKSKAEAGGLGGIGGPQGYRPPTAYGNSRGGLGRTTYGDIVATGDLDVNIIRRYVKRQVQRFTYCYEKEVVNKQGLAGTVSVRFTIDAAGLVSAVDAVGVADGCVADTVEQIEFPKPRDGKPVEVCVPLRFDVLP